MKAGIDKAIKYFGSAYKLAKALDCTSRMGYYWVEHKKMSGEMALKCERLTKGAVKRYELNTIIFPPKEYKILWPKIKKINHYPD